MLFWVIAAVLTAIVTLALLGPVARARSAAFRRRPARHDMEVYRDQLAEVDRDLADGLVDEAQAEVARTEISRRLLAASRKSEAEDAEDTKVVEPGLRRIAVYAVAIFMPLMRSRPIWSWAARTCRNCRSPLVCRPSRKTPTSQCLSRAPSSIWPKTPTMAGDGPCSGRSTCAPAVSPNRLKHSASPLRCWGRRRPGLPVLVKLFFPHRAGSSRKRRPWHSRPRANLIPNDPRPQFFLAIGMAQAGKRDEARAAFNAMIETAPEGAPWIAAVESQIAALDAPSGPLAGPVAGATEPWPLAIPRPPISPPLRI
jgi:cytochrome c-type biogenesis protein CcmH